LLKVHYVLTPLLYGGGSKDGINYYMDLKTITKGREKVEAYRVSHKLLHSSAIPKEKLDVKHQAAMDKLLADLRRLGWDSLNSFYTDSNLFNVQEMGYTDTAEYYALKNTKTELEQKADNDILISKWN